MGGSSERAAPGYRGEGLPGTRRQDEAHGVGAEALLKFLEGNGIAVAGDACKSAERHIVQLERSLNQMEEMMAGGHEKVHFSTIAAIETIYCAMRAMPAFQEPLDTKADALLTMAKAMAILIRTIPK